MKTHFSCWAFFFSAALAVALCRARADGPSDNAAATVRRVPPPGINLDQRDAGELGAGLDKLEKSIKDLESQYRNVPQMLAFLPDVEVYAKAVRWALSYQEFFNAREIPIAMKLLLDGQSRTEALRTGKHPWTVMLGPVVRGYRSRIDQSVQPYGLVVPTSYRPGSTHRHRLDLWFHGRGETLSELNFINDRQRSIGEFAPPDAFVLHLYGRYCNANKFAGEIDCLEALEHVRRHYPIDENRICVRGFSMGGAACWQFAVHYPGLWAAAAPGAGFAETPDFLRVFQKEAVDPPAYERLLWHLYNCTDYAINLSNCPTVAYSGEIDKQKQAADIMAKAMAEEGLTLTHIIGPKTAHAYEPGAKTEINRRIDAIVARGRNPVPSHVRFTTWTLRYNNMLWVTIDGLEKHWERARVDAEISGADRVVAKTTNVSGLTFSMPSGSTPLDTVGRPHVQIDGQDLLAPAVESDRSWNVHLHKENNQWTVQAAGDDAILRKRHGLQGPIDDAFMDSFIMVRPTGSPLNDKVGKWVKDEMAHAAEHWRRQFRGIALVKNDMEITDADIAGNNLVLWGDPRSNRVLAKIADKLPVRWLPTTVTLGAQQFDASHCLPLLIYPNPLNPHRYVVLNSGFTFREYDYLNNARQVPKLPDYAVIDVDTPADARRPGGILSAGFFDEHWALP